MIGILLSVFIGIGVRILIVPILVVMGIFSFWLFPLQTPSFCGYEGEQTVDSEPFEWTGGEWMQFSGGCD